MTAARTTVRDVLRLTRTQVHAWRLEREVEVDGRAALARTAGWIALEAEVARTQALLG